MVGDGYKFDTHVWEINGLWPVSIAGLPYLSIQQDLAIVANIATRSVSYTEQQTFTHVEIQYESFVDGDCLQ